MKRAAFALGLGIAAAAIASLLSTTPLARAFENQTYDARLAWSAPLPDQKSSIAMVEINDSSLQALEGTFGRWPWPRVVHSGVIDFLARGGARVIVYDVLFLERDTRGDFAVGSGRMSGSQSDAALVESVRRAGNVILAASASSEGLINPASRPDTSAPALPGVVYRPGPGFQERLVLELPFDDLKNAAAGVGHTVLIKDTDGSARRQLPFIKYTTRTCRRWDWRRRSRPSACRPKWSGSSGATRCESACTRSRCSRSRPRRIGWAIHRRRRSNCC